jgi:hypothetical protein
VAGKRTASSSLSHDLGRLELSRRAKGDVEGDIDPGRQRHPLSSVDAVEVWILKRWFKRKLSRTKPFPIQMLTSVDAIAMVGQGGALCRPRLANSTESET